MSKKRAIGLAIECLEKARQQLAFEANMCDQLQATYPAAVSASKKRKNINEAITILQALRESI